MPIFNPPGASDMSGVYLPLAGGTMDSDASISFDNGSRLQKGTTDQSLGGAKGVSLRCSVDYELNWQAGYLTAYEQDGSTLRPLLVNSNIQVVKAPNAQTGSYSVTTTDIGGLVDVDCSSPATIEVPTGGWPMSCEIVITQLGTGAVTIAPGSGVTINSYQNKTDLAGRYASCVLRLTGTDTWLLTGNLV